MNAPTNPRRVRPRPGSASEVFGYMSVDDCMTTADPGRIETSLRPPYYAVIFTNRRDDADDGYPETSARMLELAAQLPGFLGIESVRDGGVGITVSYWQDEASIAAWKQNVEHLAAQANGRGGWYQQYRVRVAKVEREYGFGEPAAHDG